MVAEKYAVRLSSEGRAQLERLIRSGQRSARVINRARILLKSDEGWSAPQVAAALDTAQPISVLGSCPAWSVSGPMCATRAIPARTAVANTAPVGICRLQSSPSRAGAGQDLVSTVLIPRAINDAQNQRCPEPTMPRTNDAQN